MWCHSPTREKTKENRGRESTRSSQRCSRNCKFPIRQHILIRTSFNRALPSFTVSLSWCSPNSIGSWRISRSSRPRPSNCGFQSGCYCHRTRARKLCTWCWAVTSRSSRKRSLSCETASSWSSSKLCWIWPSMFLITAAPELTPKNWPTCEIYLKARIASFTNKWKDLV